MTQQSGRSGTALWKMKDVYKQDGWAARITPVLRELILPRCPETILEIGPGWGNFTAELAECCRQLSCLDISPDVLSFLNEKVPQKEGKPEIRTICSKWETLCRKRHTMWFLAITASTGCWI